MNTAIIGSGNMAYGIGTRLVAGGNTVTIYSRELNKSQELAEKLGIGAIAKSLVEPIEEKVVIMALPYAAIFEILEKYKTELENKIIVDISNPVDYEKFELLPPETSSGAEEISIKMPSGSVLVKAFNTTFSRTLQTGIVDNKKLDVFVASDDTDAAQTVVELAESGGLRGIYVGGLKRARALEGMQLIVMSLQEKLRTNWMSALKILP